MSLSGDQLPSVFQARAEAGRVWESQLWSGERMAISRGVPTSWQEMAKEIIDGYYQRLNLTFDGHSEVVMVRQEFSPVLSPLYVRIRLDGYKVEFEHNEEYKIPPPQCWEKQ